MISLDVGTAPTKDGETAGSADAARQQRQQLVHIYICVKYVRSVLVFVPSENIRYLKADRRLLASAREIRWTQTISCAYFSRFFRLSVEDRDGRMEVFFGTFFKLSVCLFRREDCWASTDLIERGITRDRTSCT
jgi:hypothetical protein